MSFKKTGEVTSKQFNESFQNFKTIGNQSISSSGITSGNWVLETPFRTSNFLNNSWKISIRFTKVYMRNSGNEHILISNFGSNNGTGVSNERGSIVLYGDDTVVFWSAYGTDTSYHPFALNISMKDHYTNYFDYFISFNNSNNTYTRTVNSDTGYTNTATFVPTGTNKQLYCAVNDLGYISLRTTEGSRICNLDLTKFSIEINNNVVYSIANNNCSISSYQTTATDFIEI